MSATGRAGLRRRTAGESPGERRRLAERACGHSRALDTRGLGHGLDSVRRKGMVVIGPDGGRIETKSHETADGSIDVAEEKRKRQPMSCGQE